MKREAYETRILTKLMFRLLPVQILLAAVACFAALFLEEMAGNVAEHGFMKDTKQHTIDIRIAHKDGQVILRIRDDCVPFDPGERQKISSPDDPVKNIGIRMVYQMAKKVEYQSILGLNVLTIRI